MTIDKDKLRALAEAATQGEWGCDGRYVAPARQEGGTTYVQSWRSLAQTYLIEDARFIAAANPATILALLGEIERLELIGQLARNQDGFRAVLEERDQLKAENARLKSQEIKLKAALSLPGDASNGQCLDAVYGLYRSIGETVIQSAGQDAEVRIIVDQLKAENEALQSQVATLQADPGSWQSGYDTGRKSMAGHADNWRKEADGLRKDARRWKCVRNAIPMQSPYAVWREGSHVVLGKDADDLVDNFLSAKERSHG